MYARTGDRPRTPMPLRENEMRSTGSGPVISYFLSAEELAKMREKDGPAPGLTRQLFIEMIAAGETLASIEKAWKVKYNTIYNWVTKWNLKGLKVEAAQKMLSDQAKVAGVDSVEEKSINLPEQTASQIVEPSGLLALNAEREARAKDNQTACRIIETEIGRNRQKDIEIERLTNLEAEGRAEINRLLAVIQEKNGLINRMQLQIDRAQNAEAELRKSADELIERLEEATGRITQYQADIKGQSTKPIPMHPEGFRSIDIIEAVISNLSGNDAFHAGCLTMLICNLEKEDNGDLLRNMRWHIDRMLNDRGKASEGDPA